MQISFYAFTAAIAVGLYVFPPEWKSNPVDAVAAQDTELQTAFQSLNRFAMKSEQILIDASTDPQAASSLISDLGSLGYAPVDTMQAGVKFSAQAQSLALGLTDAEWDKLTSDENINERANRLMSALADPIGGTAELAIKDPLGLGETVSRSMFGFALSLDQQSNLLAVARTRPLVLEEFAPAYELFQSRSESLKFIGADLFAYENFLVIKRDLTVVSILTIPLSIFLFWWFCRSVRPTFQLFIGSLISALYGVLALKLVDNSIYTVVLAFASTLVGFNNEYLAHLSGIAPGQWRREFSGLLSAIGTTFIGFVFLLFAENTLLRQIALVCMGGSFGFIAFMLVQQGQAKLTKFRTIRIPAIYLNLKVYTLLAAVLVTGVMWGPRIDFRTSLVSFRFDTPMMQRNVSHFSERLAQFGLKDAKVIGVKFDDFNKMINDESLRVGGSMASVLAFGKRLVKARSDAGATPTRIAAAMKKFESALFARGIELSQPLSVPQSFVTDWNGYAKWIADYSPVPQMAVSASKIWLVDTDGDISRQLGDAKIVHDTFAASPMSFYESVLTEAQQHMLLLLAVALGVMALYLRPLQRSWVHVMQIVVPLVAALALLRWVLPVVVQDGVNLVHVAGLFFIMTVALDYSSIAVSSKFNAEAISKLALTGAISFIGFASLIFATHPMIKSLGVTVALGIAVSWIFGVCVRLRPPMTVGGVREA